MKKNSLRMKKADNLEGLIIIKRAVFFSKSGMVFCHVLGKLLIVQRDYHPEEADRTDRRSS